MISKLVLLAIALFVASASAMAGDRVLSIKVNKDAIDFMIDAMPVASYHTGTNGAKPYFWPMYSSDLIPVTRAWPMEKGAPKESRDHVHQKSAWFCHGDVIPEGVELRAKIKGVEGVDFWSEAAGHGKIICVDVGKSRNSTAGAPFKTVSISTRNEWRTDDDIKILDETRMITYWCGLSANHLIIIDIDLHASVCPITFGDTKEGAFGVRVNDEIRLDSKGPKNKMTNADGKSGEKDIWGYRSDWCDYSGEIGGKLAGIAVFDDPKNSYRACWHSRAYGLMAANPFGRDRSGFPAVKGQADLVKLKKGEHLKLRYGIYLHTGDAESGKVAEAFKVFCGK